MAVNPSPIDRPKVTTVAQARALPEVEHPYLDSVTITNHETGITATYRKPRPFYPHPTDGDQILFFGDIDGRCMQVVYTENGPAKTEWRG